MKIVGRFILSIVVAVGLAYVIAAWGRAARYRRSWQTTLMYVLMRVSRFKYWPEVFSAEPDPILCRVQNQPSPLDRLRFTIDPVLYTSGGENMTYTIRQRGVFLHPKLRVLFLHGNGYMGTIQWFQWWFATRLVEDVNCEMTVPLYPSGPDANIEQAWLFLTDVWSDLLKDVEAKNQKLVVIGDSAGAGLALSWLQHQTLVTPISLLVLISPWVDVTMSNPACNDIEDEDPILYVSEAIEAGVSYAGKGLNPKDTPLCPLFSSMNNLPPTLMFTGTLDILHPQALDLAKKIRADLGQNFQCVVEPGMCHDYALMNWLPEGQAAYQRIVQEVMRKSR